MSNRDKIWIVIGALVAGLILLYHDARQAPVGPTLNYARRGLQKVSSAGEDPRGLDGAVQDLYEALRMDPNDPVALFGFGWALQKRGAELEAQKRYAAALAQLDQLEKFTNYNLGLILEARGDRAEALKHFQRALRADPSFSSAQIKIASLERVAK